METKFRIVWMGTRRAEDRHVHVWGYGRYEGRTYSFWRLKRTDALQFKDAETYSRQSRRLGGDTIQAMLAEKLRRGYQRMRLCRSRRRRMHTAFLVAMAFTGLHTGRRRAA
jgi:hypothetical protein